MAVLPGCRALCPGAAVGKFDPFVAAFVGCGVSAGAPNPFCRNAPVIASATAACCCVAWLRSISVAGNRVPPGIITAGPSGLPLEIAIGATAAWLVGKEEVGRQSMGAAVALPGPVPFPRS